MSYSSGFPRDLALDIWREPLTLSLFSKVSFQMGLSSSNARLIASSLSFSDFTPSSLSLTELPSFDRSLVLFIVFAFVLLEA